MRHSLLIRFFLLGTLMPAATWAQSQNSDFSFTGGYVPASSSVRIGAGAGVGVAVKGGGSLGFNFGHTIHSWAAGDLYYEMPFVNGFVGRASVSGNVSASNDNFFMWTPGVRFKFPTRSWLEIYAVGGGGFGTFSYHDVRVGGSGISVITNHTLHGVFDAGGILDFRVSRLISLRVDVRDYVTGRGLGGVNGRHHPIFTFGLALHH